MRLAIFCEQDGILNRVQVEKNQQITPQRLDQFQVNEAAIAPLRRLKAAGYLLIATTNQPGLSKGSLCRRELERMHDLLRRTFSLDDIFLCPHDVADNCPCRKPKPGLLTEAAFKWHIDLDHSFVVSDKWQDAEAARLVGCTSFLLQSPWIGRGHRDFLVPDLVAVVKKLSQIQPANHALVA